MKNQSSEIVLYQTDDGRIKIEVQFDQDTAWMTQEKIAQLFATDRSSITKHINNIYKSGELIKATS